MVPLATLQALAWPQYTRTNFRCAAEAAAVVWQVGILGVPDLTRLIQRKTVKNSNFLQF